MRLTPAAAMSAQALAREPWVSISAAGVIDDTGLKSGLARVERAPRNTKIRRQSRHEQTLDLPRLEVVDFSLRRWRDAGYPRG